MAYQTGAVGEVEEICLVFVSRRACEVCSDGADGLEGRLLRYGGTHVYSGITIHVWCGGEVVKWDGMLALGVSNAVMVV